MNDSNEGFTICVDLDGVLLWYDDTCRDGVYGYPLPGAREFLSRLKEMGKVVIFTARICPLFGDVKELQRQVEAVLKHFDLPYDEVFAGEGKPPAQVYIDDRAVECKPQLGDPGEEYERVIEKVRYIISR